MGNIHFSVEIYIIYAVHYRSCCGSLFSIWFELSVMQERQRLFQTPLESNKWKCFHHVFTYVYF